MDEQTSDKHPFEVHRPTQRGWICPVCGRGNAPWNPTCDCEGVDTTEPGTTITINSAADAKQLLNVGPPYDWGKRYGY